MAADPDPTPNTLTGNPIVQEANKRMNLVAEYEANFRTRFINDLKFRHGDADNAYQWPNMIKRSRDVDSKPCLTVNIIRQHNLMISNQAKQNKSSIKISAKGGGSTIESAKIYGGLIRNTEYVSNAQAAYATALDFAIDGGKGWWRLVTDYVDNESDDQEVYIKRVADPLAVYADPDCQEKDKSDMKFLLFFDLVRKEDFNELYPRYKDVGDKSPLGSGTMDTDFFQEGMMRVCEYFRKVEREDTLIRFVDPQSGERKSILKSKLPKDLVRPLLDDPLTIKRLVKDTVVEWYLIAGEMVVDKTEWIGKMIPWIPVVGEELVIDGQYDCKGHTRNMMDAQRMYNYNASAQVEFVALQSKTPWIAPAKAIEEYEAFWSTANVMNYSVLPYNDVDEDNPERKIDRPFRQEPPNASPAYQAGMETAFNQMMMSSGQWQNQMGMGGNERTGAAIDSRKAQSDTSVFHFQDNFEAAKVLTGKMLIEIYPKLYDTKRVQRIVLEDGTDQEVELNPGAPQALTQFQNAQGEIIRRVLNPKIGKYEVVAQVGPAYGTRREQTVDAMNLILTQNPGLTGLIGDLFLGSMDFDQAQEAAKRMKRMVPPQALGTGPSQSEQAMAQQLQNAQAALATSLQAHGKDKLRLTGKAELRDIDAYKAQTDRMKILFEQAQQSPEGMQRLVQQLVKDALHTELSPLIAANQDDVGVESGTPGQETNEPAQPEPAQPESPPMKGAKKAQDGQWYLADPSRRGKYLRIAPLAEKREGV